MNGIEWAGRQLTASLLKQLDGPLPQRVLNVDTNEKADLYALYVSSAERDHLIRLLRRL